METEPIILDEDQINIIIPVCCREGWPDCPHVPQRQKQIKKNIGL